MTANDLIRRIQRITNQLTSGDIPIKIDGKDSDRYYLELIESGKGYYVNIKTND